MSWPTIVWSAGGGICLALAGVHLVVWLKSRGSWANLAFSVVALMGALTMHCELGMMYAPTPAAHGAWHWRLHYPLGILLIALAWFIRAYLRAGRWWLLWSIVAMRLAILVANFVVRPNLNFYEVSGLRHLHVWGEDLVVAIGTPRPWTHIIGGSGLVLMVFAIDASVTAWRRGQRRQGAMVGATLSLAVILGVAITQLHDYGLLSIPYTTSLMLLFIVVGMAYELSVDLVRVNQLSQDLRETQSRMRLATDSADLGIWEWNVPDGKIWTSEPGRARLGAAPGEEITIGRFLRSLHANDRRPTRETIDRVLEAGDALSVECRLIDPEGAVRWLAIRGKVERDARGRAVWLRGVTLDITERKRAEAVAQEREEELRHAARVGQLGELSSALAHELNQPLTAILSNAQAARRMLVAGLGDLSEFREILDDIVRDDRRAGEIIHRMRGFIATGHHEQQRVDLQESIRIVADLLRGRLAEYEVVMDLRLPADVPAVRGDPIGVQQVLLNLMMNATEAMSRVGMAARHMTVTGQRVDSAVVVRVSDTGPGVSPELASRIFEPFESTKPGGLGLGLAICKRIAETHGGSLWLEAASEPGARFCFSLPVWEAHS